MSESYQRPSIAATEFTADDGAVIEYGNRWGMDTTPDEAYSRGSRPERFAGLHAVADALLGHLRANYGCVIEEGLALVPQQGGMGNQEVTSVRAVRITPSTPDAAPLIFEYLDFPSVQVHAGLLHAAPAPTCGCDACDETLDTAADELERVVLAVAAGEYKEWFTGGFSPALHMSITFPGGSSSSAGPLRFSSLPRERIKAARAVFKTLPGGWQPWPARAVSPH
ncbi:DUF6226 family protein [Arthrobacter glacialis]|uniref:DUF6226 family protein n=1 Tax=Arthrobacter glacialis TaxID=1664 RepID=UPI000CD41890|nr:DUF6226 family protein [Arthrobacter glacialis]POH58824.1 hypothetical protein CVS28_08880 [Arthrobacter glacialis]